MATHVVNTAEREADRSGTGWIVAIIALLALVLLFLFAGVFFNGNVAAPTTPVTPDTAPVAPASDAGNPSGGASVDINASTPAGTEAAPAAGTMTE